VLAENEREAVADLLQYLENVFKLYHRAVECCPVLTLL
jgi:hypothetical protein